MADTTLTADVVAKAALAILDNELGWVNKLYRAHEDEYSSTVNGYKKGATLRIRRPADFTVRSGAVMSLQDTIEGYVNLTVDQQIGVDFDFTEADRALKVTDLAERFMMPAMKSIINYLANDLAGVMYKGYYNWVGTQGQTINSFSDWALAPQRADEMGIPSDGRLGLLSPADWWGLVGGQAGIYVQNIASDAIRNGELGNLGGVDLYMSQVTPSHTTGSRTNVTPLTNGTAQNVTYDTAKNSWTCSLTLDGAGNTVTYNAGDVFTCGSSTIGLFMVNPRTKANTGVLQNFVVTTAAVTDGSGNVTVTVSPPIILSGPHQTCTLSGTATTDNLTVTNFGTASTVYKQNMLFHKNSMALAVVPMEMPPAAYGGSRKSEKGFSVRVLPIYDGTNDVSKWRFDMLYGRAVIDPRIGLRVSGT